MDPITMMALAQLIPMGIKLGKSGIQGLQANKLAKTERPEYKMPEEVMQALNQAKYLASMKELPGQNLMEDKIGQNVSKGISELERVSSNPAEMSSNVAKMYMGANDQINNIGVQAAQQWLGNQGMLGDALNNVASYKDKEFDYNKNQPYQNNMAASSALREGSFKNFNAGMGDLSSAIGGYANMKYFENMLGSKNIKVKTPTVLDTPTSKYKPQNSSMGRMPFPIEYQ